MSNETKNVVITGASSGIGAALARLLGSEGHRLVLAARREADLVAVAQESGAGAVAVVTDVVRRDQVIRLREEALRAFGTIDVWVNNAGRGISRSVMDLNDEDLDEMMSVNVKSALYGMQAVVPHFLERGRGHLLNISSFLGRVPLASHRSAYNAAKAALNALTANLRADLRTAAPGVHISLVMPGLVTTDFARNVVGTPGPPPPWIANAAALPAGTMKAQTAEEVARIIAGVIEKPVAELYTNPASAGLARRYFEDVAAFEEGMR